MAKHLRAEVAALHGRPHLAQRTLDELEDMGYPDDLLEEVEDYIETHLAGRVAAPETNTEADEEDRAVLQFRDVYVGGDFEYIQDDEQTETWMWRARGGFNPTPQLTLEGHYGEGRVEQTLRDEEQEQVTTETRRVITDADGVPRVVSEFRTTAPLIDLGPRNIISREVYDVDDFGNEIYVIREFYQADFRQWGSVAAYRHEDSSLTIGRLARREYETDIAESDLDGEEIWIYGVERQWKPTLGFDVAAIYEHGLVPSAKLFIEHDMFALIGFWKVQDFWDVSGMGHYYIQDDDNQILSLRLRSMFIVNGRQGLSVGVEGRFRNAEEYNRYYWTPNMMRRISLVGQIERNLFQTYVNAMVRIGSTREEPWVVRELGVEQEDQGWDPILGARLSFNKELWGHWDLNGEAAINILSEYQEKTLRLGLLYNF